MIDARDYKALLDWISEQEPVRLTIECGDYKKTVAVGDAHRAVCGGGEALLRELNYLLHKRTIELAREMLHARGELGVEPR